MERERIAEELARIPALLFAVLFGSRQRDHARADSDWDIGIYLDEACSSAERERVRGRLVAALEPSIHVDVVLLNDAPALLARRALDGERLLLRDRRAWVRFAVRTLSAAGDEMYWQHLHARERERRLAEGRFGRP
jgi:predicted nucleotidyltransferase